MQLKNIFRKMLSLFSFELVIGISNFLAAIIIARELGLELFGIWGLIMMTLGYGEAFGRLKVDLASVYVLSEGKYSPQEVLSSINIITMLSSSIVYLFVYIFSNVLFEAIFKQSTFEVSKLINIFGIIFFLQNFFYIYLYMNLALQKTDRFGLYNMFRSLLFLFGVMALSALDIFNLQNLLKILAFSFTTLLLVMIVDLHSRYGNLVVPRLDLNLSLIKRGINYYFFGYNISNKF